MPCRSSQEKEDAVARDPPLRGRCGAWDARRDASSAGCARRRRRRPPRVRRVRRLRHVRTAAISRAVRGRPGRGCGQRRRSAGTPAPITERRTARYGATLLARFGAGDGTTEVTLALDGGARVLAHVRGDAPPAGARVLVRGRLEPFDEARNPGEPSERALQAERGLDGRLEGATLLRTAADAGIGTLRRCSRAHTSGRTSDCESGSANPARRSSRANCGESARRLPPELRSRVPRDGYGARAGHGRLAPRRSCGTRGRGVHASALPRWLACCAAIALLWSFVWWSGAQLPAVRAATMASAALAARACGRATLSWNALAIAALVIAFARPQSVANGVVRALVFVRRRDLRVRRAVGTLARRASGAAGARARGDRADACDAARHLAARRGDLLAVRAVRRRGQSRRRSVRRRDDGARCRAARAGSGARRWRKPVANLNSWLIAWTLGAVRAHRLPSRRNRADDAAAGVVHRGIRRRAPRRSDAGAARRGDARVRRCSLWRAASCCGRRAARSGRA